MSCAAKTRFTNPLVGPGASRSAADLTVPSPQPHCEIARPRGWSTAEHHHIGQKQNQEEQQKKKNNASPHARPALSASQAGQREDERELEEEGGKEEEARPQNVFTSALFHAWDGIMAGGSLFNPAARIGAEGVSDLLDNFPDSGGACCYGALEKRPKLQNALTKAVEDVKEHFHVTTRTQEETVRAREAKAPGAKGACLAQPRSRETTLPPDAAKFASTYRLGTATAHDLGHCPCGTGSPSINHILSCKNLRGRFVRHDVLVNVLVDMLHTIGVTASAEVMILEGSQKRMDIVVTLATGRVWVDVSVVNPLASTYVNDKTPLVTRQKQKKGKYGNIARERGVRFIPFIVSTFGEFLKWVASEALPGLGKGLIHSKNRLGKTQGLFKLTPKNGVKNEISLPWSPGHNFWLIRTAMVRGSRDCMKKVNKVCFSCCYRLIYTHVCYSASQ